ncbi:MAG TPA: response regulator [Polyangiaceae bacterium]|nr:response regulator [Polyangiaceae bacterium]
MTSILIVEDDEQLRSAVARDLSHRGFEVTAVISVDDAVVRLRERGYDVLLTDLRMGERDGIDLLAELPDIAPSMPAILMSAFATARDHQRAIELGAVQVLCKPFTSMELSQAIRQAIECETGFRGSLHGVSLVDVLQMFHLARRSVCVTVGGRPGAEIHVKNGEIVHAEQGELVGEPALRRILGLPSGSIRTGPLEGEEQSISRAFQGLVLDMLRGLDEESQEDFLDFEEAIGSAVRAVSASVVPSAADAAGLCAEMVTRVEGACCCGAVDLDRRTLLGLYGTLHGEPDPSESLVGDAVELLRAPSLEAIEALLGSALGTQDESGSHYREARLLADDTWRLMLTIQGGSKAVVLVTRRETSPGLAFWHLRACIPAFERAL